MSTAKTEETIGKRISDTHSMRVWRLFPSHRRYGNNSRNFRIADPTRRKDGRDSLKCYDVAVM
jgi:hypothetical protein